MAELTAVDVELYTRGRLPASDVETTRILYRALAAARRFCEWHVTPIVTGDVVTLDGPGHHLLMLPTLQLQKLNSVTETWWNMQNGVFTPNPTVLDLNSIEVSSSGAESHPGGGPVRLRKRFQFGSGPWGLRWSRHYGSIVVNMDHGYLESDAEDFRLAVLDACDRFSLEIGRGGLQRFHVDDVVLMWFEKHDAFNTRLLEPYRLMAPV